MEGLLLGLTSRRAEHAAGSTRVTELGEVDAVIVCKSGGLTQSVGDGSGEKSEKRKGARARGGRKAAGTWQPR